ncbi:unnamed protein product, partial [Urochloa humidicola]
PLGADDLAVCGSRIPRAQGSSTSLSALPSAHPIHSWRRRIRTEHLPARAAHAAALSLRSAGSIRWPLRGRWLRGGVELRPPPPGMFPAANQDIYRRCFHMSSLFFCHQIKNGRWRPAFVLETGGPSNTDGQDFDEDSGFLGSTRLGRLIQAAGRELLEKLNSSRINTPTKIFLVLLGFYTANALATILGQTGDWDVLVAAVVVAAIEGIGMLMYRIPITKRAGRIQSLVSMVNYWKAGVCLGLFVDAFKVGS